MDQPTEGTERGTPVGRRLFLGLLGVGAVGVRVGRQGAGLARAGRRADTSPRTAPGSRRFLPIGRFRIYTVTGELPEKSKADYRLKVDGLVDAPYT